MRVLLTNARLESWYGSELYLRDVARWLRDQGHEPIAYSARLGSFAAAIRAEGIAVVDDLADAGGPPDLVHAHHHLPTLTALTFFPQVPAVAFCHGVAPWEELPVVHPRIHRYVAVSGSTRERLVSAGVALDRVRVIPNFVDTDRFRLRADLPANPRRALLFSNHARSVDPWVQQLRAVCLERGISLDLVGESAGNPVEAPETLLPGYDLVFARGRAALEAMATGAAVIVCDVEGLAQLVTPESLDGLREGNFGRQVLVRPNDRELLAAEIDRYDRDVAGEVSRAVRSTLSRDLVVPRIFELYREAMAEASEQPMDEAQATRALAAHLRSLDASVTEARTRASAELTALRHEFDTFRSRFLVRRVVPALWRVRKVLAPAGSRRYRAYMRVRSTGRSVIDPADHAAGLTATASTTVAENAATFSSGAQLDAVVIDVGGQPGLVGAVRSLLDQQPRPEIVVVSSGGGTAEQQLRDAGIEVDVVQTQAHLLPGAARNLGIAATHAPFVAFLAADCVAEPGWVAGRLAAHEAGARIVSSAVVNDAPANPFAVAAHTLLFSSRLPRTPRAERLHYGASYDRALFREHGRFRDDVRIGEDSEFHSRLGPDARPVFRPDVRVAHHNPKSLRHLLADAAARGARAAAARRYLYGEPSRVARERVATNALQRLPRAFGLAWRAGTISERMRLIFAAPWLLPGTAAYSAGAALGHPPQPAMDGQQRRPDLVALIQFRNESRYLPGFLDNISAQVDAIIALDDGSSDDSTEIMRDHPSVAEVIRVTQAGAHVWDEPRNRSILVDAAIRRGASWVVAVDADERLENGFRQRAEQLIRRADQDGVHAYSIAIRELWGSPAAYRVDGVWGRKRHARLFRVPEHYEVDHRALHGYWPPDTARRPDGQFELADLVLYHLAMIDPADRETRKQKYKRLDPDSRWQAIGYDYLTDETGLELEHVPGERDFRVTMPS
jgi:glycosyltransferase involved in cell wall biosynthesis